MRTNLKMLLVAVSALVLSTAAGSFRPLKAQSDQSVVPEPAAKKVPGAKPKSVILGGHINDDGTVFISDRDLRSWKITNPGAVKDHTSEHVRISAVQNAATGTVTVRTATEVKEKESSNP